MKKFGKTLAAFGALCLSACTNAESGVAANSITKPIPPSQLISAENEDYVDILPDELAPLFQETLQAMESRMPDIGYPDFITVKSCDFLDKWNYNPYTKEYRLVAIEVRLVREALSNSKLFVRVTNDSGIVSNKYVFPYDTSPLVVISNDANIKDRLQKILEGTAGHCSLDYQS